MDLNSRVTHYFYWELEKFCFFILVLLSCKSKLVCRHQSTACLFLFVRACPSEGFYFWESGRPSYGQYFWSLGGKISYSIRLSLGWILKKHISAPEFLWETRACLTCLSNCWALQCNCPFNKKRNWNFHEKLSGNHKMCCCGSHDCSARSNSFIWENTWNFMELQVSFIISLPGLS